MANETDVWVFTADEAKRAAQVVADHDPDAPRTQILMPHDAAAAAASVLELRAHLERLPMFVQRALEGAASSAGQLSDDRLQGLAELIQNADDLGATDAYFTVDETNSRLLFAHNGGGLTLHDVLALAVPWLSLKISDPEMLGRFGIGLKTLHSLSEVLEVHEGHFHLRLESQTITPLDGDVTWPGVHPYPCSTAFAVPFGSNAVVTDDVASWLDQWGEGGLVFLRHLTSLTLLNYRGEELRRLSLDRSAVEEIHYDRGAVARRTVTASDGRQWLVYSRRTAAPVGKRRARKAQAALTPIAVAFPQFDGDIGILHVGLPVRPVGLPFRIYAQFDPLANRRDINHTEWNLELIPLVAHLWCDAALDLFGRNPSTAWAAVPLVEEFSNDERTTGQLREVLETHLMTAARLELAQRLRLDGGHGEDLPLASLAYEVPALELILKASDVEQLADTEGAITKSARSHDQRWRDVLAELNNLGGPTGPLVDVSDAITLLLDADRSPAFIADLTAVTLEAGMGNRLWSMPCLVLDDGTRTGPDDLGYLEALLPEEVGDLWDTLNIGVRAHPEYRDADGWEVVSDWLQNKAISLSSAPNYAALQALAAAGQAGTELAEPLTDDQAAAVRGALEAVHEDDRARVGPGIGRAVRLAATSYDERGNRIDTYARPCDAYIIEREANTWHAAAGQTPGLVWLHRRYATSLRAPSGREGLGAQRLFRILGAETAPRIIAHPKNQKRYQQYSPGVNRYVAGSPDRRTNLLERHHATYTVGDHASPHLDAVLHNITAEKDPARRRRRAAAVLASLARAWDRLEPFATAMAASEDYGWVDRGRIEAWWLSSAASIPWLTSEKGTPAAPGELRIKTIATKALYGDDPERYLAALYATSANLDVLVALGVGQDAGVLELIGKLEEIRAETLNDPVRAADLAAPLYKALAGQITATGPRQSLGTLGRSEAQAAFRRDDGLIATNIGWRRPTVVFGGPAIFGDRHPFVPSVTGTEALWNFLGIRPPGAEDAKTMLRQLAKRKSLTTAERMMMLESLRILADARPNQLGVLRRMPVWIGDKWLAKRPVYAVVNPLIAESLQGRLPIWAPGGALGQLDSLIEPLNLTCLDATGSRVLDTHKAIEDPDLTRLYGRAVMNLRADLALSDPRAEESLSVSWDDLAQFQVRVLADIRVRLAEPTGGAPLTLEVDAWLDMDAGTLYVTDATAAGRASSGAYAIASAFTGDTRRISHDWVVAWSEALAGHEAEKIATAASEDADRKRERDDAALAKLREFAERAKKKRGRSTRTAPTKQPASGSGSGAESGSEKKTQPPRLLIDTSNLTLRNGDGQIIGGSASRPAGGTGAGSKTRKTGRLADPDFKSQKKTGNSRGIVNYTAEEREDVGMELVRQVLGANTDEMVDIRNQHGVGADAIDELRNFYELKVYSGALPDEVRLQDSQVQRAYETENFFLVVVCNVERGGNPPEVRIITDPLGRLNRKVVGHVTLSGVQSAKALQYIFDENEVVHSQSDEE
ncbi:MULTISPECIES: sacsin N-terminal ATP-binding-like domain-containing protein [Micromonospora]|nr:MULTISPECIES: hypothetical protein [Micromonospora]